MESNNASNFIWWLLTITTLGGLFFVKAAPAEKETPKPAVIAATEKKPQDSEETSSTARVLEPLRQFMGCPETELPSSDTHFVSEPLPTDVAERSNPARQSSWDSFRGQIGKCASSIDCLILTVADPKDTRTNYRFDMHIDALHKAVQADSFTLDSYYLPWQTQDNRPLHRTEPGLILYRKRNGDAMCKLLAIFLVGETQTSGIQKAAFAKAINLITELNRTTFDSNSPGSKKTAKPSPGKQEVYIAGPIFSGSADSLAVALKTAHEKYKLKFTVITGSANYINIGRFEKLTNNSAKLHMTIGSGSKLKDALIEYVLEKERKPNVPIAWLTEFNTGPGSHALHANHPPSYLVKNGQSTQSTVAKNGYRVEMHEFIFPANISGLRDAFNKASHAKPRELSLSEARHRLEISNSETASAVDSPRTETPLLTAPTAEILISQILSTIHQRQIRYVGISATDARDPVFFAELIRRHCPGVQIMLVSPDIIHLHSQYRRNLQGALVASSHCLTPEEQNWCYPGGYIGEGRRRYTLFSSQSNCGIYNSLIFLRGLQSGAFTCKDRQISRPKEDENKKDEKDEKNEADNSRLLPLAYGSPLDTEPSKPCIWISRVGSSAFVPITTKDPDTKELLDASGLEPRLTSFKSSLPPGCRLMASLWILGSIVLLVVTTREHSGWASPLSASDDWPSNYVVFAYVCRAIIAGAMAFTLLFFWLLAFAPIVISRSLKESAWFDLTILVGASVAIVMVAVMYWKDIQLALQVAFRQAQEARSSTNPGRRLNTALLVAQLVAVAVLLVLTGIGIATVINQAIEFRDRAFYLLWFTSSNDLSAGASMLPAVQALSLVTILLSYGLLHQIYSLRRDRIIPMPRSGQLAPTAEEINATRAALLFPLLCHHFVPNEASAPDQPRETPRPDYLSIGMLLAIVAWCLYGRTQLPPSDYFSVPVSLIYVMFFALASYWFVRVIKLQKLSDLLERVTTNARRDIDWEHAFKASHVNLSGLQDLLWHASRPNPRDRNAAVQKLRDAEPFFRGEAEINLYAIDMQMFIRQICVHIKRLVLGLIASAVLLFVAAQSYPLYLHPLLRLTASFVLCAIGVIIVLVYVRLDRNAVVSALVGTKPNEIELNWTLARAVAPGLLLAFAAILNQTFPDATHWLIQSLEPLRGG